MVGCQGISNCSIHLIILEYSSFVASRVDLVKPMYGTTETTIFLISKCQEPLFENFDKKIITNKL